MDAVAPDERRLAVTADTDLVGELRLSVRDTGPGIAVDPIERVFDPFVSTKPAGLGLGLAICRTIVAAHGGRLWAENEAGGGATFHLVLPTLATTMREGELAAAAMAFTLDGAVARRPRAAPG